MYDFIHIETYPLKASAKKAPKTASETGKTDTQQTVKGVVGEAIREPENCPHVEAPQPPSFLLGTLEEFENLPELLENRFKTMKNEQGRAYRKDTHVLLAGTASYPKDGEHYEDWKRKTVAFLRTEYGDNLRYVIEHTDEEHPHLHFYAFSDTDLNARKLHDGCVAEMNAEKEKGERLKASERRKAYADGCREYLDRFHASVGVYFGMDRVGPKRRRLSRSEYNAEKAEKMKLAEGLRELEQRAQGLDAEAKQKAADIVKQHIQANYQKTTLKAPELGFFDRLTMSPADIVKAMEPQLKAVDKVKAGLKLVADDNERLEKEKKTLDGRLQDTRVKLATAEASYETEIRSLKSKHAREQVEHKDEVERLKAKHQRELSTALSRRDSDVLAMVEMMNPDLVKQVRQKLAEPQKQDLNTALTSRTIETASTKTKPRQDFNTTLKSRNGDDNDGGGNFGM